MSDEIVDHRKPGWFWMHNAIIDHYGPRLRPIALAVYMCLARHANKHGESIPSKRSIAAEIGCSETAVTAAIKLLSSEEIGLLTVTARNSAQGDPTSNLYTLMEPPSNGLVNIKSSLNVSGTRGAPGVDRQANPPPPPGEGGGTPDAPPLLSETPRFTELNDRTPGEIWDIALTQLRLQMTKSTYQTWVHGTTVRAYTPPAQFDIAVANIYAHDWLSRRLQPTIERTLAAITGCAAEVTFTIRPAGDPHGT
jgi:hypothetical protein